jgi:hypothetical protein
LNVILLDTNLGIPNNFIYYNTIGNDVLINEMNKAKNSIFAKTEKYKIIMDKYSIPLIQAYFIPVGVDRSLGGGYTLSISETHKLKNIADYF